MNLCSMTFVDLPFNRASLMVESTYVKLAYTNSKCVFTYHSPGKSYIVDVATK